MPKKSANQARLAVTQAQQVAGYDDVVTDALVDRVRSKFGVIEIYAAPFIMFANIIALFR
jgi:hypothetical protein